MSKSFELNPQDCAFIIRYDSEGKYSFEMAFPHHEEEEHVPPMELAITAAFLRIVHDQDGQFIEDITNWFTNKHAETIAECEKEVAE